MVLEAVVQALRRVEQLKSQLQNVEDLLDSPTIWDVQQKAIELYRQVLLLELEYALDQKLEQDLWNYGHRKFISALQGYAKDKNNPRCSEAQNLLIWFLDSTSGFYVSLLGDVCTQFKLDLPFRREDSTFGLSWPEKRYPPAGAEKKSLHYICQHFLVHLGDIARYRNSLKQAEIYYKHAVTLSPMCGHPYNQLALLAVNKGDNLSAVFHGVRSIAVQHPFPVAAQNLDKTLSRCASAKIPLDGKDCLSSAELVSIFLKFHALLKCQGNITEAKPLIEIMGQTLTTLVAIKIFSEWKLVQMLVINIYMLKTAKEKQKELILDLIGTILSACLLPIYTFTEDSELLDYAPMPSVKLTFEWITLWPSLLEMPGLVEKKQILPGLCYMLDRLSKIVNSAEMDADFSGLALPEDKDIQGFLPLKDYLLKLKFSNVQTNELEIPKIRCASLLKVGESLVKLFPDSNTGQNASVVHEQFILRSMKDLSVSQQSIPDSYTLLNGSSATSPVHSDGNSWETGKSTPDSSGSRGSINCPDSSLQTSGEDDLWNSRSLEKEKIIEVPMLGRTNQNVAMQAILRGRQVTDLPPANRWNMGPKTAQTNEMSLFGKSVSDSCYPQLGNQKIREYKMWGGQTPADAPQQEQVVGSCKENFGTSLFSFPPSWCVNEREADAKKDQPWKSAVLPDELVKISLWRPSPALNRLLEQQKQQREGGT
ncbi:nonsense-mediated mRNA decay factor SMG7-like isoform X1 [Cloeon dipterum]|uniref:nonsense-mediated mRNA decay factor SMG7-like isoform X1 n=1 Tax=Cloeon dipterum TaxID=197152 RepID=UPI00321FA67C